MRKFLLLLALGLSCAGWVLAAKDERGAPAVIDAQDLSFDRPANMAYGKGDVVIRYRDAVLRADQVKYNTLTEEVWAEGNVRLNRQGQEWVAPAAYYKFDTREFRTDVVAGFVDPVYVHGTDLSQVGSNQYRLATATATTCDYADPHYRVQATRAQIFPGDRVVMYNCTLYIGDVPVFWLPAMVWSLTGDGQPFSMSLGQSSRWGFYVLTTTHVQLNKQLGLDVHLDGRTDRGMAGGADLHYRYEGTKGMLRGYYANDGDPLDRNDVLAGRSIPTDRYRAEWQHKQFFPGDVALTMDLNKQSDPDIVDDFFNTEFRNNIEPASVMDVTKRGQNYTLSAGVRPQLNNFFAEVERLPEVTWSVNRVRIGPSPLFYEGESSAGYYNNEPGRTADPLFRGSAVRTDTFHQLLVPQTLFGWLSVVPRASGRYTYYTRAPGTAAPETQDVRRVVANLGTEVSFKLSQTWAGMQNERLGIDGLRHIVQPFADYSWIPTPNVESNEVFQFDTIRNISLANGETFPVTRYLPVQFPAFHAIDAIDRENTVRFGLRQKLQTRRDGKPWDLLELTGWTDFRIERDDGQEDFSNLFGTLEARPIDWLALNTFARYDMHGGVLREFNTEARVSHRDQWAVGVGTRFLEDDSNLVAGSITLRLARRWVAQVYQRFDMHDGQWEEQDYLLRQELHDWFVHYGFRYRSERTQRDEMAVYFAVTLKAFPGVQLGMNRVDLGSGD